MAGSWRGCPCFKGRRAFGTRPQMLGGAAPPWGQTQRPPACNPAPPLEIQVLTWGALFAPGHHLVQLCVKGPLVAASSPPPTHTHESHRHLSCHLLQQSGTKPAKLPSHSPPPLRKRQLDTKDPCRSTKVQLFSVFTQP